ncbi:unnamed protein product [Rangifer tarandus platyrhynchus]|uniref:Uncharacterized protein n=1 Tax=Rangifer tarandus platyrhynchus TaxID=3082113 RepID=A0AC59ZQ51_RANTA
MFSFHPKKKADSTLDHHSPILFFPVAPGNHQSIFCLSEFAHYGHSTSMDSYSICPVVSGFFYIMFSRCIHVLTDIGTVSPLHVNEFHSESPFVNPIFRKSNKVSLGTQPAQLAI